MLRMTELKSCVQLLNHFSCDDLAKVAKPKTSGGPADDVNTSRSCSSYSFKLPLTFLLAKEDMTMSQFSLWAAISWPKNSCCLHLLTSLILTSLPQVFYILTPTFPLDSYFLNFSMCHNHKKSFHVPTSWSHPPVAWVKAKQFTFLTSVHVVFMLFIWDHTLRATALNLSLSLFLLWQIS